MRERSFAPSHVVHDLAGPDDTQSVSGGRAVGCLQARSRFGSGHDGRTVLFERLSEVVLGFAPHAAAVLAMAQDDRHPALSRMLRASMEFDDLIGPHAVFAKGAKSRESALAEFVVTVAESSRQAYVRPVE